MKEFFEQLVNGKYQTTVNAKGLTTIQQTERNKLRANSMEVFAEMLKASIEANDLQDDVQVYRTKAGIVIGVYNIDLDQEICFELSPSIPALADGEDVYNPAFEQEEYLREVGEKAKAKQQKELAKQKKAQKDAELRAKLKANKGQN